MKKINIFYILALLLFTVSFAACEDTNENLVKQRGVAAVPEVLNISPAFYTTDFKNSYVKFDVDLPEGQSVDHAEIHATFKDKTAVIQEISSFPATIKMIATDVISKLGLTANDVKADDSFMFDVVTTSGGVTSRSMTGAIKAFVTCEYDPEIITKDYNVVIKDWDTAGGDVTFTVDPLNPFKISIAGLFAMEGGEPNDNVLVLNIDPNSYKVSGVKTKLGTTDPFGEGYTNYYYEPSGLYKSCEGVFEMQIKISVDEGSFGAYSFIFTPKNPA
ncbi:MAG: hypothetical protein ACOH2V_05005 [Candidatus Saccharimonadaceae bacterium]